MTMRARLSSLAAGRSGGRGGRAGATAREAEPAPPAERVEADTFEWRMRSADGPTDRGLYACGCGFQFAAPVETGVCCPHCGAGQAW